MKIAIDCRKLEDFGIGTYIRGLVGALETLEGPERFVLMAPERVWPMLPEGERFARVRLDAPAYSIRELLIVGGVAERSGADLLHEPHYVTPWTSLPVVVTIHDLIHLHTRFRNPLAPLYARVMLGHSVRASRMILTPSRAAADDIALRWPEARARIRVAHNGVDASVFAVQASADVLSRYGVEEGRYLLYAGNDKPHKNVDRLIEAFSRAALPSMRLVLAGFDASRFSSVRGVIRTGLIPREDLLALMSGACALVAPSLEEGFGLPVLEAMACGTAVVISDIPALREVAGEGALRFDPRSVESITDALERIVRDEATRVESARSGRDRAREFTWRKCAEETLGTYREALGA